MKESRSSFALELYKPSVFGVYTDNCEKTPGVAGELNEKPTMYRVISSKETMKQSERIVRRLSEKNGVWKLVETKQFILRRIVCTRPEHSLRHWHQPTPSRQRTVSESRAPGYTGFNHKSWNRKKNNNREARNSCLHNQQSDHHNCYLVILWWIWNKVYKECSGNAVEQIENL